MTVVIGEDIDVCYDFHQSTLTTEDIMHLPTDKCVGEHQIEAPLIYSVGNIYIAFYCILHK